MAYNNKSKKNDTVFEPKIIGLGKYTKDNNLIIGIKSINYSDFTSFNRIGSGIFEIKNMKDKFLYFEIKNGHIDEFKNKLPELRKKMEESGHYDNTKLDEFFNGIIRVIDKTPTNDDIKANDTKIASNWKDLLKILKDPQSRQKFLLLQTTNTFKGSFENSTLSLNNIKDVLMSDPQATFVTSEECWAKEFNRIVVDKSNPIIIKKVYNRHIPHDLMRKVIGPTIWDEFMKNFKADYNKYKSTYFDYQKLVRKKLNLGRPEDFYKEKVYDVRFTQLMPGKQDIFLELPNLVNNLTGEINEAAKELARADATKNNATAPDFDEKKIGLDNEEKKELVQRITKLCADRKLQINATTDDDIIIKGSYEYAYNFANSSNILHKKNVEPFAAAVAVAVSQTYNIKTQSLNAFIDKMPSINDDELLTRISLQIHTVYKYLVGLNDSVNESIINETRLMSVLDIKNMLKKFQKEKINETKNKIIDLMSRLENM